MKCHISPLQRTDGSCSLEVVRVSSRWVGAAWRWCWIRQGTSRPHLRASVWQATPFLFFSRSGVSRSLFLKECFLIMPRPIAFYRFAILMLTQISNLQSSMSGDSKITGNVPVILSQRMVDFARIMQRYWHNQVHILLSFFFSFFRGRPFNTESENESFNGMDKWSGYS